MYYNYLYCTNSIIFATNLCDVIDMYILVDNYFKTINLKVVKILVTVFFYYIICVRAQLIDLLEELKKIHVIV